MSSKVLNKRRERTRQWHDAVKSAIVADFVSETIEKYNFECLIHTGVIVEEPSSVSLQAPESPVGESCLLVP